MTLKISAIYFRNIIFTFELKIESDNLYATFNKKITKIHKLIKYYHVKKKTETNRDRDQKYQSCSILLVGYSSENVHVGRFVYFE